MRQPVMKLPKHGNEGIAGLSLATVRREGDGSSSVSNPMGG
jgi:hypothetical protein